MKRTKIICVCEPCGKVIYRQRDLKFHGKNCVRYKYWLEYENDSDSDNEKFTCIICERADLYADEETHKKYCPARKEQESSPKKR